MKTQKFIINIISVNFTQFSIIFSHVVATHVVTLINIIVHEIVTHYDYPRMALHTQFVSSPSNLKPGPLTKAHTQYNFFPEILNAN
jgi:hypothetical protein